MINIFRFSTLLLLSLATYQTQAATKSCVEVQSPKRVHERNLKPYLGLQKKECAKLPYLHKNYKPLRLLTNQENDTALMTVDNKAENNSRELHYVDVKEGKLIKKYQLGGLFSRNMKNISKTFISFDRDSRVAFTVRDSFCVFNLKESTPVRGKIYRAKLDGCSKIQLKGRKNQELKGLESLSLSQNEKGRTHLWSLENQGEKKLVHSFRFVKGHLSADAVHTFELPKTFAKAERVSFLNSKENSYTLLVSKKSNSKKADLHKVTYLKDKETGRYKVLSEKALTEKEQRDLASLKKAPHEASSLNSLDLLNLETSYKALN